MPQFDVSVSPPYLRYSDPAESAQIAQRKKELRAAAHPRKWVNQLPFPIVISTDSTSAAARAAAPGHAVDQTSIGVSARRQRTTVSGVRAGESATSATSPVKKTEQFDVTVSPDVVSMGWNCSQTFIATTDLAGTSYAWTLYLLDPVSGVTLNTVFLAGTSTTSLTFSIDSSTYGAAAYATGSGSLKLRVECITYSSGPDHTGTSIDVPVDFGGSACISLNSVSVPENTFVGGSNGSDPVLTMNLDGPAPPGGQAVFLNVSDTNIANIMGDLANQPYIIAAGLWSDSISWFLGTKSVMFDHTFNIEVTVNGATGLVKIYLHDE